MPLNGSINRTIGIGLQFTSTSFVRDVGLASDSLKTLERTAATAQTAVSKIQLPGASPGLGAAAPGAAAAATAPTEGAMGGATAVAGRVGSAIASIGPQMATSLQAGLSPLTQIANVVQQQLNLVGGIVEQLAARIEGAMKFGTLQTGLTNLQARIRAAVSSATAANQDSLTRLQRATLALGPAAAGAVTGFKGFLSVKSFFSSLGTSTNQTRLSLQKMNGISLAAPTSGAARMANQFRTMAPVVNRVSTSVKGLGIQIGLALGVVGLAYKATTAVMGFFTAGIKGAIDLNETMNVVNVTFEDSAGIVTETANTMASKFGLAKGVLLDAANAYGGIFQGAGMSAKASAELSAKMVTLAADVTSFKHIKLEDSLAKIQSALTGESKPLKDLGVAINENMIKQRAQSLGLQKGKEQLSEYAKTTAIASLVSEKFTKATGDLERTQDSTANQFLRAGGGMNNFATTIGTMLLPMVNTAVGAFNELLASLILTFEENRPMIQEWADSAANAFLTVSDVLASAGDYFTIFKLTTIQNLSNVLAYVETIPANLSLMATYIGTNWRELIYDGINAVATYFKNLGQNIADLIANIYQFMKDPTSGFNFNFTPLLKGFQATAAALPEMIKPPLISMQEEIDAAGKRIADRTAGRVQARATAKVAGGPRPEALKEKPEAKPSEYKAVAAAEIGSAEAGSAIARFLNQGGAPEAKQTADNTKQTAKHTKDMAQAIKEIAARGGTQAQGLATFTI